LLCITKAVFEKLTTVMRESFGNDRKPRPTPAEDVKTKSLLKVPVPVLYTSKENKHSCYMPTKIWATRYSELWQWQRVSEWHREYGQDEITNEKRHILV
jgi:hypothetical protein